MDADLTSAILVFGRTAASGATLTAEMGSAAVVGGVTPAWFGC